MAEKLRHNIATEHQEQVSLFKWARTMQGIYPQLNMLFAIPNAGKRSITTGKRFVKEGLSKGFPDIGFLCPRQGYHGLFIEMKRVKDSYASKEQKAWIEKLNNQGYLAVVCKGWEEAKEVIERYLK